MTWLEFFTPFPGGNRRLALVGFLASLKKLEALVEASIQSEEALETYWAEIIEETASLKKSLTTREERRLDNNIKSIFFDVYLRNQVRERDGDTCRFCGRTVNWESRNAGIAGTYIPLRMDAPTREPEEIFVGCKTCLTQRKRDFKEGNALVTPEPLSA